MVQQTQNVIGEQLTTKGEDGMPRGLVCTWAMCEEIWIRNEVKRNETRRDETKLTQKKKLSLLTSWAGQGTVGQQWSENISQVNQFNAGF
jgi:hypothetical protein